MSLLSLKKLFLGTGIIALAACGGGGGGGGGGGSSPPQASSVASLSSSATTQSSTSSTSSTSSMATEAGTLLDSPVINIGYKTATQTGVTDSQGRYQYLAGETVVFFIGDLEFPGVAASGIVTPLDIAGTGDVDDPAVVNMLRLLQTLDKDGNPDNGISITDAAKASATNFNFTSSIDDFAASPNVQMLIANAGQDVAITQLVSVIEAIAHFEAVLASTPSYEPPAEPAATELLINGGLEDSPVGATTIEHWNSAAVLGAAATFTVVDTEAHSGTRSLKLSITSLADILDASSLIYSAPEAFAVKPLVDYRIRGWVKGTAGASVDLTVLESEIWNSYGNQTLTLTGEWQSFEFIFKPKAGVTSMSISFDVNIAGNAGAVMYLDDFSATELTVPKALSNGGLEASTVGETEIKGWYTGAFLGADVSFVVTDQEAHSGDHSLKVTINSLSNQEAASYIYSSPHAIAVKAGGYYTISGWVKGTEGASFLASVHEPYVWRMLESSSQTLTGDWQRFNFTVKVESDVSQLGIGFDLNIEGNTGAVLYLDDFEITKIASPTTMKYGDLERNTLGETDIQGWNVGAFGGAEASFTVVNTEKHTGAQSLRIDIAQLSPVNAISMIYGSPNWITVVPGVSYTFSGWVKGTAGAKVHTAVLEPVLWRTLDNSTLTLTGEWQQFSYTLTPEDNVTQLAIGFDLNIDGNAGTTLYLDDFKGVKTQ